MFSSECAVFSCDDMNKIKVGALAVSRYHQIQRFFSTDDVPNLPDHDFPVPGYLLIPSSYMRLMPKKNEDDVTESDSETALNDLCEDDGSSLQSLQVENMTDCVLQSSFTNAVVVD